MSQLRSDYDSPWKNALEWYFTDFMAFFFPLAHADIEWQRPFEFLDKELQQIVRDAELGRRHADKLAKVWRKSGKEEWVLAHIEIQGEPEGRFDQRMYVYNYRLFDRYERQVASFAVLADTNNAWRPGQYGYELWGCKVLFDFPTVKLADYAARWAELEASDNPFATVIMAHLKAQETQHDPPARYQAKFYLVRRLYERGYTREHILKLFHFIDWIMALPPPLALEFWQDLHEYEESKRMEYVTSVERIGIQKGLEQGLEQGREEGLQQGATRAILRLLSHRFGVLPPAIEGQLGALAVDQLEALLDLALSVPSIEDFVAGLPAVDETTSE